jgi:hypothetical protein
MSEYADQFEDEPGDEPDREDDEIEDRTTPNPGRRRRAATPTRFSRLLVVQQDDAQRPTEWTAAEAR